MVSPPNWPTSTHPRNADARIYADRELAVKHAVKRTGVPQPSRPPATRSYHRKPMPSQRRAGEPPEHLRLVCRRWCEASPFKHDGERSKQEHLKADEHSDQGKQEVMPRAANTMWRPKRRQNTARFSSSARLMMTLRPTPMSSHQQPMERDLKAGEALGQDMNPSYVSGTPAALKWLKA